MKSLNLRLLVLIFALVLFPRVFFGADEPSPSVDGGAREYPNLLWNPGFEVPDFLHRANFEFWMGRPYLKQDREVFHSGAMSVRSDGPSSGYTFPSLNVPYRLKAGETYIIGCWVKTGQVVGGKGVWLECQSGKPEPGKVLAKTEPMSFATEWQEVTASFTAPQDLETVNFRVNFDLREGDKAWVDDAYFRPDGSAVEQLPTPVLKPAGGDFEGPVEVEITSVPGAAIYYTIDGTEPTVFSTPYVMPVRIPGRTELRARAISGESKDSGVAAASFKIRPGKAAGVPQYPVGFGMPVTEWWKDHPMNPKSPAFVKEITSPEPRIDVSEVRDKHPESVTAGIAEALALVPEAGGTLWFPKDKGPYVLTGPVQYVRNYYDCYGQVLLIRRSNIHFVSDGAVLVSKPPVLPDSATPGSMPPKLMPDPSQKPENPSSTKAPEVKVQLPFLFGITSMDFADRGAFQRPNGNFYFKNLIFEGAINMRHVANVVIEGCTFRNIPGVHRIFTAGCFAENLWFRGCTFEGIHRNCIAVYCDGVLNFGFLNCTFGPGFPSLPNWPENMSRQGSAIMCYGNNDLAPFVAYMLTCQDLVVDGCTFLPGAAANAVVDGGTLVANGSYSYIAMPITVTNALIQNNAMKNAEPGGGLTFANIVGVGISILVPHYYYTIGGVTIRDNTVERTGTFVEFTSDLCQRQYRDQFEMKNEVSGNAVANVDFMLALNPSDPFSRAVEPVASGYARIENIDFTRNRVAGLDASPRIKYPPDRQNLLRNIQVTDNTFSGPERPLFWENAKTPAPNPESVVVKDNKFE